MEGFVVPVLWEMQTEKFAEIRVTKTFYFTLNNHNSTFGVRKTF